MGIIQIESNPKYNLARQEASIINSLIKDGSFTLLQLSKEHKNILLQMLQK